MEPAILSLTIAVSANTSSSLTAAVNNPNPTTTDLDNPVVGGAARPAVRAYSETMQPRAVTAPLSPLSRPGDLPVEGSTAVRPVVDNQTEASRTVLHRTEEATNTMKTWNSAVEVIRRVMDAVNPIAEVCPISLLPILH
jgi:hypothetical protein